MKKNLLVAAMLFCSAALSFAQKTAMLKTGTVIPLQAVYEVKAADAYEGQNIDFRIATDIKVDGKVVISQGDIAKGKVVVAKKSSLAGTKGKLEIDITDIVLSSGDRVFLNGGRARVYGKNRTPLAVITGVFVWPCLFIPGTKAVMPAGYEVQAYVSSNTEIPIK